jgi:RimJ/RimL family protein N-acetyltransferase
MDIQPLLLELPEALVGEKVVVRPWRSGDGLALYEAVQESLDHILPWLPWGPKHSSATESELMVRRWRANWDLREDLSVSVWERQSGRFVGGSGLHRIDWKVGSFEIGYWIRASEAGHGYVTEAVRLLSGLAFDTLGANRVFIRVAVENFRSAAIPRRLGFVLEGTMRNQIRDAHGQLRDAHLFSLTPSEWKELTDPKT